MSSNSGALFISRSRLRSVFLRSHTLQPCSGTGDGDEARLGLGARRGESCRNHCARICLSTSNDQPRLADPCACDIGGELLLLSCAVPRSAPGEMRLVSRCGGHRNSGDDRCADCWSRHATSLPSSARDASLPFVPCRASGRQPSRTRTEILTRSSEWDDAEPVFKLPCAACGRTSCGQVSQLRHLSQPERLEASNIRPRSILPVDRTAQGDVRDLPYQE